MIISLKVFITNFMSKLTETLKSQDNKLRNELGVKKEIFEVIRSYNFKIVNSVLDEILDLADFQIKQKAIRLPEFVKGINKAGMDLKQKAQSLRKEVEGK